MNPKSYQRDYRKLLSKNTRLEWMIQHGTGALRSRSFLALCGVITMMAGVSMYPKESGLVIRDANGQIRGRIGMFVDENRNEVPALVFYDADGQQQIITLAARDEGSHLSLQSEGGSEVDVSTSGENSVIEIVDSNETPRLSLSFGEGDGAGATLNDKNGFSRVAFSDGSTDVSGMVIGDDYGIARAGLFVNPDGPVMLMKDAQTNPRLFMSVDQSGPRIVVDTPPESAAKVSQQVAPSETKAES